VGGVLLLCVIVIGTVEVAVGNVEVMVERVEGRGKLFLLDLLGILVSVNVGFILVFTFGTTDNNEDEDEQQNEGEDASQDDQGDLPSQKTR